MPGHRSNATRILLLTALAAALTACGGFVSTTSTSPAASGSTATSGSSATGSATSRGSSPATSALRGGKEAIPRLAGDTLSVAELYLRQLGLRAGQTLHKPNTKYQSGLVITTSPYAGDVVPYGSAVDLLVSMGSPGCQQPECPQNGIYVTMPDVLGQTIDQVTTTLALDGITLGSYAVEASSAARGTVICTDPAAMVKFSAAMPVEVGVSSGDPNSPPATLCEASSGPPPTSPTGPPPNSPSGPPPTSPSSTPSQPPSSPPQPTASP
jgi:eukaryotic-like serine/threonine-protein kinase